MSEADTVRPDARRPLRLWPGVVIVALQWVGWSLIPRVAPDLMIAGILGAVAAGPLLGVWWLFFSRAAWSERLGAAVLVVAAMAITPYFLHESIAQGNMGFQFIGYSIPLVSLAFVAWAVATRNLRGAARCVSMAVAVAIACGVFTLLRSKGIRGDGSPELTWRWAPTAEERLLASTAGAAVEMRPPGEPILATETPEEAPEAAPAPDVDPAAVDDAEPSTAPFGGVAEARVASPPLEESEAEHAAAWPGFRGPARDGVLRGLAVATDWEAAPPVELWRRPVGPGVSSFAVADDRIFTQEQRGEHEVVSAYDLATGEPVWRHADENRVWDSHVGAGPRATPAVAGGRVYTLGADGRLSAFEARDGRQVWSRAAASDTGAEKPLWGFVSSPLVVGDLVLVDVGGLVAYDRETGEPCWFGPKVGTYSSPQLVTIDGAPQVLLMTHEGVTAFALANGRVLWEHAWAGIGIVQPVLTADGDLLISTVDGGAVPVGTRRLAVQQTGDGWAVEERWTSNGLKPSFSQVVVHEGHAYGFDGRFVACVDAATGERRWKGGRYGSGQVLLLADQDLLLVVGEQGDLALVAAQPDGFSELARVPGVSGRTWNQPALVGDVLLVRNGEEMAAFRLPPLSG